MAKEAMKELQYDGKKVVVEVARRDALGNTIDATYATKTEMSKGDTDTLSSAKSYTAGEITTEIAARKKGDSDTLASAKSYTDDEIAKIDHSKYVTIDTQQTISGTKQFLPGTLRVMDTSATLVTIYNNGSMTNGSNEITYPSKSGTLALTSDVPENLLTATDVEIG